MVGLSLGSATDVMVGNDSGWALSFHTEEAGKIVEKPVLLVGRERYYAEVEATLPNGDLSGASYKFTIEGLVDADYGQIAQKGSKAPTVVRLYLYWRDTNQSFGGFLANLGGLTDLFSSFSIEQLKPALVAELAITRVSRQVGERRYETVVTAAERVSKQLAQRIVKEPIKADGFRAAVLAIGDAAKVSIVPYMNETADPATAAKLDKEKIRFDKGVAYRDALRKLAKRFEQASGKRGRGMMLVRDGTLYWGVRPIPLKGEPKKLDLASGLIETQVVNSVSADKNFETTPVEREPRRRQLKLTLKGRPDIKPGDVVTLVLPPEELGDTVSSALTSAVSGVGSLVASLVVDSPLTKAYVESVVHRLGRLLQHRPHLPRAEGIG